MARGTDALGPIGSTLAFIVITLAVSAHGSSLDAEVLRGSSSKAQLFAHTEISRLQRSAEAAFSANGSSAVSSPASEVLVWAASRHRKPRAQLLAELAEENDWKNDMVMWMLPESVQQRMPRPVRAWFRCYVMCMAVYMVVGSLWAYYIYYAFGQQLFASGQMPGTEDMLEQIKVSCLSIPLYSVLPAFAEWVIEQGWTKAFSRISDVGLGAYLAQFALYMTLVEFAVYWMHRLLHDVRPGYRYLHYIHHKYNKEHTLSPFAGLAFHPLDGILQAIPYFWTLFLVPAHALTFELLLFATGVWTTNIHDCLHGKMEPIMGAGYHSIHHTTYKHNYGHYFVYMDKLFGTLITPEEYQQSVAGGSDEKEIKKEQ